MISSAFVQDQLADFRLYLPKCLSDESANKLLAGLLRYPACFDGSIYSFSPCQAPVLIYQGDCFTNLDFVFLPDPSVTQAKGLILSNTCDLDLSNDKKTPRSVIYAPLFNLMNFINSLVSTHGQDVANEHLKLIRHQQLTQFFYLPSSDFFKEEAFVDFGQVFHCPRLPFDTLKIKSNRIFSLNNLGFYVLLFKLSVFFCRLQEGIDRI